MPHVQKNDSRTALEAQQWLGKHLEYSCVVSAPFPVFPPASGCCLPESYRLPWCGAGETKVSCPSTPQGLSLPSQGEDGQTYSPHFPANTASYI